VPAELKATVSGSLPERGVPVALADGVWLASTVIASVATVSLASAASVTVSVAM